MVTISAVVSADFQGSAGLSGFFVQDEDADADADPFTSEGLFVFDPTTLVDLSVGDLVSVIGTVSESFGQTQIAASFIEVSTTAPVFPTATVVDLGATGAIRDDAAAVDYVVDLEAVEGMLVTFPEALTVTEMFNLDRFGEYRVSDGRSQQFTQSKAPDVAGLDAHLRDVTARFIVLDEGSSRQNPAPTRSPTASSTRSTPSRRSGPRPC